LPRVTTSNLQSWKNKLLPFVMCKYCPKHLQDVTYFTLNILLAFREQKEETMMTEELVK